MYFAIYFIYLLSLLVDWQLIMESEYLLLGIYLLIVMASVLIGFSLIGYNISGVSGWKIFGVLCFLIALMGIILFYQQVSINITKYNIENKISKQVLTDIHPNYHRNSIEIGLNLTITDPMIMESEQTLNDMWQYLMSHNDINNIIEQILGCRVNEPIDVLYDLLWYLCVSNNPFGIGLTRKEIKHIFQLTNEELIELLETRYIGSTDRASLLFTMLSGQMIPMIRINNQERYNIIKDYNPNVVYNLVFLTNMIPNLYGPYTYLSIQEPSEIEQLIINITYEDYETVAQQLSIGPIKHIDTMTEDELISHLRADIVLYKNVFTRAPNTPQPPSLVNMTRDEMNNIMSLYTNLELIEAYEPRKQWKSRADLIKIICEDILNEAKWSIRSIQHCNNDDTINVLTTDRHGDIDKNDPDDPTISYGVHKNYRCYQCSELEASFDDYDGIFLFRIPDWTESSIDPITQQPLAREFTLDSIKQLKILLEEERYNYNIDGLLNKIQTGLDLMKSANVKTRYLKQQLSQFTSEQKHIVNLYLAWMFTYSMWMRFWKGPGTPWPVSKVNVLHKAKREKAQRSSPEERDEHIFIQEAVRTSIIEMYETDNILKEWIESLPTIYYDFDTGDASCATHNIKETLDKIAVGNYCMGFGSDTILKTSYYYITYLLEHHQGNDFDQFIESMFPLLHDLEYNVVTNQLNSVSHGVRFNVLNSRLSSISQPIPKQQSFNPSSYENNIHVDL